MAHYLVLFLIILPTEDLIKGRLKENISPARLERISEDAIIIIMRIRYHYRKQKSHADYTKLNMDDLITAVNPDANIHYILSSLENSL